MVIIVFIPIVDTHYTAGECQCLAEGNKYGLVDLSLRVGFQSAEEEHHAEYDDECGGDELYVSVVFHRLILKSAAKVI
jgi:hypothetical protein